MVQTTMNESSERTASEHIRWRSIAIPAEHGGWGMLFGPILLGLLVVPSMTAVFLAVLYIAAFLARTPLKIVWKNSVNWGNSPQENELITSWTRAVLWK